MKINIFSLGLNKNKQLHILEQEYLKRLTRFAKINQQEFKTEEKFLDFIKQEKYYLISLEETGKKYDSLGFSAWLNKLQIQGQNVAFIVADEAGFSDILKKIFNDRLSLSALTYPHEIARLLLCEQLYRAFTILHHHPYHK